MKIPVGIVTYNPDSARFKSNFLSIINNTHVSEIIIVDNNSSNIKEIEDITHSYNSVTIIRNTKNEGIAKALNQICKDAIEKGYEWVVTLDQDSIISDNLLKTYSEHTADKQNGIVCCRIEEVHYGTMYKSRKTGEDYISQCITSGNMINLKAISEIGFFNEALFIDGVDFDICIRMTKQGYKILRVNEAFISHEIGHSRKVSFFGKTAMVLNHSETRLYYIARNYIYIGIKYRCVKRWLTEVLKRILLVLIYENKKIKKTSYMIKGIYHGVKGDLGPIH